jgi:hypothetical protein
MNNRNITNIKTDTLQNILVPFGFRVEPFMFDDGLSVTVWAPNGQWVMGDAHWGDDYTAAGDALRLLIARNLVPQVVIDNLVGNGYDEESDVQA